MILTYAIKPLSTVLQSRCDLTRDRFSAHLTKFKENSPRFQRYPENAAKCRTFEENREKRLQELDLR